MKTTIYLYSKILDLLLHYLTAEQTRSINLFLRIRCTGPFCSSFSPRFMNRAACGESSGDVSASGTGLLGSDPSPSGYKNPYAVNLTLVLTIDVRSSRLFSSTLKINPFIDLLHAILSTPQDRSSFKESTLFCLHSNKSSCHLCFNPESSTDQTDLCHLHLNPSPNHRVIC
jgi:hypothetical protein